MAEYKFINKTLFFPEKGILAVGDLHIGYEYQLQQSGVLVPERQVEEIIEELKKIFKQIGVKRIKKIVFIGDIKHSFGYEWKEKDYFNRILEFLKKDFEDRNIILIKGNHDTIDYSYERKMMKKFYIIEDIAFLHGHEIFPEVFDYKIKTLVMGHIHPSVLISDKQGIKKEKYKCFLTGKFKNKETIVLPSFLSTVEGTTINEYEDAYEDYFSIIPKKDLLNFEVHVIGEDKVYDFGKIRNLN
jgi:uncharacterized protein